MVMSSPTADAAFGAIVAAVTRGDRKRAISLAAAALDQGLDEPLVLLLAAEGLEDEGRAGEAFDLIRQAVDLAPEQQEAWRRLGNALVRSGKVDEGLAAFRTALKIGPDMAPTLIAAGGASYRLGELTEADGYFRRAAKLAPGDAEPMAGLAAIASRQRRPAEARALAGRALALRPHMPTAEMAIARADLSEGLAEDARARMARLLDRSDLYDDVRVGALDLRSEALDLLGLTDEAFADYQARNAIVRRINAPRIEREIGERRVDQARRLSGYFLAASPEHWRTQAGRDKISVGPEGGHAFLVGFPRSGTTLLERVLAGHPGVVTLEEVDHLGQIGQPWLADAAGLDALARLSPQAADSAREAYWRGVRETVGFDPSAKLLVDKLPLHTLALPVIAKLFPRAKILFALRDPRDVTLSCFRRSFRVNSAMFEFLTLDDAARYYHEVMTLAEIYRSLLSLEVMEVRHEVMVADFETTVRSVLAFLELQWDPMVAEFSDKARIDPRTPSDVQLARGLNAEGVGQWRRYKMQMDPVLAMLQPWAKRFGYAEGG
jgi:tetratricopeptide (TPR) repeat protein